MYSSRQTLNNSDFIEILLIWYVPLVKMTEYINDPDAMSSFFIWKVEFIFFEFRLIFMSEIKFSEIKFV